MNEGQESPPSGREADRSAIQGQEDGGPQTHGERALTAEEVPTVDRPVTPAPRRSALESWQPIKYLEEKRRRSITNRELLLAAGNADIFRMENLLRKGADVKFQDAEGNTCLHWVAETDFPDSVRFLLQNSKTNISVENWQNQTPLDVAWQATLTAKTSGTVCTMIQKRIFREVVRVLEEGKKERVCSEPVQGETTFCEATLRGDYGHPYNESDIDALLNFFCQPLPKNNSCAIPITITFKLNDRSYINLFRTYRKSVFYTFCSDGSEPEVGTAFNLTYEPPENDPTTFVLLGVRLACETLSAVNMSQLDRGEMMKTQLDKRLDKVKKTSYKTERQMFAAILHEIKRTEEKANACLEMLNSAKTSENIFYKLNAFLFFLESLALGDTHPAKGLPKTEKSDGIAHKKKEWFERYYRLSSTDGRKKLSIIQKMRDHLADGGKERITNVTFKAVEHFVTHDLNMPFDDFFKTLHTFLSLVLQNREGRTQSPLADGQHQIDLQSCECKKCTIDRFFIKLESQFNSFLNLKASVSIEDVFQRFQDNIVKMQRGIDVTHELIFDLLVNICPNLEFIERKPSPRLEQLRNNLIHNFQNTSLKELKQNIPSAIYDLYRYQLAQNVYETLKKSSLESNIKLKEQLDQSFEKVDEKFKIFNDYIVNQSMQNHVYDSSWLQKHTQEVVQVYVSSLAPLLDCDNSRDEGDSIMSIISLDDDQKRKLFELFLNEFLADPSDLEGRKKRKKHLAAKLQESLKLTDVQANFAANVHNKSLRNNNNRLIEEILDIMKGLYSILEQINKLGINKLAHLDLILLYSAFKQDKFSFSFQRHVNLLNHSDLTDKEKGLIERILQSFPENTETRNMLYGDSEVRVSIASIILNLLHILNEVQKESLSIKNIVAAFSDNIFVAHLNDLSVRLESNGLSSKVILRDEHVSKNVLDCIRIQKMTFTAPYVAELLTSTRDFRFVDSAYLQQVLKSLLIEQADTLYFEKLLALNVDHVQKALASIITGQDCGDERICEILRLLCRPRVARLALRRSFEFLQKVELPADLPASLSRRLERILMTLNAIALERSNTGDLEHASQILQLTAELEAYWVLKTVISVQEEFRAEHHLLEAKLLILQGQLLQREKGGDAEDHFIKANAHLSEVDGPEPYIMLALSMQAYICTLLQKLRKNNSDSYGLQAVEYQSYLWERLWKYVSSDNSPAPEFRKFYSRAEETNRYKTLLISNAECYKYLNVPKVRMTQVVYEMEHAEHQEDDNKLQRLLTTCDEVYNTWKNTPNNSWLNRGMQFVLKTKCYIHQALANIYHHKARLIWRDYHACKALELCFQRYRREIALTGSYSTYSCKAFNELESLKCVVYENQIARES